MTDYRQAAAQLRNDAAEFIGVFGHCRSVVENMVQSADLLDHAAADRELLEQIRELADSALCDVVKVSRVRAILGDPHEVTVGSNPTGRRGVRHIDTGSRETG